MSDVNNILAEAAERLRKEAYAAGWRDALAAVASAVQQIQPSEAVAESFSEVRVAAVGTGNPGSAALNGVAAPKIGTTPYYVYQAVKKRPGMTGADVVAAVRADGHNVPEPQVRTALARLGGRRLLVNRHKKWFAE